MTNLEKWRIYTRDICSPLSYCDWGFIYLVGAALQRRVWIGSFDRGIFPNLYIILVGKPGLGKGQVIGPINDLLKHHKKPLLEGQDVSKQKTLINVGADSTTFESLLREMSNSIDKFNYKKILPSGQPDIGTYLHASLAFSLEEVSSLFNKDSEKISTFLLQAYDCKDYDRKTKTQGSDILKRICLSLLGGTTPDNMFDTFSNKILSDGFASRTIFVYEHSNRSTPFILPPLSEEQLQIKEELLEFILQLTKCYGQYTYTEEANIYVEEWWQLEQIPSNRINKNQKMEGYYARKKVNTQKLCLILHHMDCDNGAEHPKQIGVETVRLAIKLLGDVEKRMHYAFMSGGRNPLNKSQKEIMAFMQQCNRPLRYIEILEEFLGDLRDVELKECLQVLAAIGHINIVTKEKEVYYEHANRKGS